MTAVPAPSLRKDRRHLRVHDAAIGDRIYEIVTTACALVVPALVIAIAITIFAAAWPAFAKLGLSLITSSSWDVGAGQFGDPSLAQVSEIAVRSLKVIVFQSPYGTGTGRLTLAQAWCDTGLRILGPAQIAMLVFAFRARIKRH